MSAFATLGKRLHSIRHVFTSWTWETLAATNIPIVAENKKSWIGRWSGALRWGSRAYNSKGGAAPAPSLIRREVGQWLRMLTTPLMGKRKYRPPGVPTMENLAGKATTMSLAGRTSREGGPHAACVHSSWGSCSPATLSFSSGNSVRNLH
jgi:hypothetical protein